MERKEKSMGIFSKTLITQSINVSITNIGSNLKEMLEKLIGKKIEGKCIVEGYIKENSIRLISYSAGMINGDYVKYEIVFECLVCNPVEGMHITCKVKNITKAGIRAESVLEPSPVVIFASRDHHLNSESFNTVKIDDVIKVRVIGQRFELNDAYISVIAEVIETKKESGKVKKPKLVLHS